MLIKVIAVQARMGERLTLEEKIHIFKQQPDFVCLPEYSLVDGSITDYSRAALQRREWLSYLGRLSDELHTVLIGGTVVEAVGDRLFNVAYVFDRGQVLGSYRKRHPVEREAARGIAPGSENLVLDCDGVRVGVMICGDVFFPERFDELADEGADVIFIPTTSPYRPADTLQEKHERDERYFVAGASTAGAYVIKVCGVGTIFSHPLQGRSLVAAPWGVMERVDIGGEQHKRLVTATLDIVEVRDFRQKLPRRTARRSRQASKLLL